MLFVPDNGLFDDPFFAALSQNDFD